ncbi:biotin transporter BioY [Rhodobacterales bacterium HKCCE3408]|nr:biotin transporter BioY [Rhodobacterales bacterium HKCCE3408]
MTSTQTLSQAVWNGSGLMRNVVLVLAGTALIALAAQVTVRLLPVPMTLQTLAILVVGFGYGARLGTATLIAYLAEGAMGLPVFAGGGASLAYMTGPTGGFLLGFVGMAAIAGYAADRGVTRSLIATVAVALLASAFIYIPGLAWPAIATGTEWSSLWSGWMAPFLLGDALKAAVAALVVTGAWAALRRS